jgi:hypothetical protein
MSTTRGPTRCGGCGEILAEQFCQPERLPCPHCGSMARQIPLLTQFEQAQLPSVTAKGYSAGISRTKGLLKRVFSGLVPQRSRGSAVAQVSRVIAKDRNPAWYTETVTMRDTGEVVHHCSEPLSEHTGHGSDKGRKPTG